MNKSEFFNFIISITMLLNLSLIGCQTKGEKQIITKKKQIVLSGKIITTQCNSTNNLKESGILAFKKAGQPLETDVALTVETSKKFQTFLGIGGAITDAVAETFYQLPENQQKLLIKAYFNNKDGIGYNLGRTSIHSCDFSSESFTYVKDSDINLSSFSIKHDLQFRIPLIKAIQKEVGKDYLLYASPWSPPAFMKTNNNMLNGGKLKPKYYQSWANYYVKFIKAYQKEGIPIWGVTLQNEPLAVQRWESCIYTAEEERDFLKNYLGPTFKKQGFGDKKIIVWDHNRDLIFQRVNTIYDDPEANKYAWGAGFHWYEDWKDGVPMYQNVAKVYETYPNKNLLFTEGCNEKFDPNRFDDYKLPERYGLAMIHDFNNGSVGFTDWNILLNEHGGPNHVGNFCFAPVIGNTQTGALNFTKSFYYIGQFSKYIKRGAKRLAIASTSNQLEATAFENPNKDWIIVALNKSNDILNYSVSISNQQTKLSIPGHTIQTLIIKADNYE
ncbi:MAG: glycoside hydrolase family 30 protein [Lutibacter sp.]